MEKSLVCVLDWKENPALIIFTEDELLIRVKLPSAFPEGFWQSCNLPGPAGTKLLQMATGAVPSLKWEEGGAAIRNALVSGWPEDDSSSGDMRYLGNNLWVRDVGMIDVDSGPLNTLRKKRPPVIRMAEASIEYNPSSKPSLTARLIVRHKGALERKAPLYITEKYEGKEVRLNLSEKCLSAMDGMEINTEDGHYSGHDWRRVLKPFFGEIMTTAKENISAPEKWVARALIPNTVSLVFNEDREAIPLKD